MKYSSLRTVLYDINFRNVRFHVIGRKLVGVDVGGTRVERDRNLKS